MMQGDLELDTITFSAAISACEKCNTWEAALQLFCAMAQSGAETDATSFNAAMSACANGGE